MEGEQKITINISTATIFKVIGILLLLAFVYFIRDILVILFVAVILTTVIDPLVNLFEKKKIPRAAGVLIIYGILFLIFALIIVLLAPPIAEQIGQLTKSLPNYWMQISQSFTGLGQFSDGNEFINTLQKQLQSLELSFTRATTSIFGAIYSIFGGIVSFIFVLVLTFYMTVQRDAIKKFFFSVSPSKYHPYLIDLFSRIQEKIGSWVKGELVLVIIIGILSMVGLRILGIKYFLVLGLLAGLFELIPYLGPVFAAVPAVFLAFAQSPWKALFVIILYWGIQQVENNIIVPKVMHRAVGLNPLVVIIVILVGAKIAGFIGILLAVPVATVLSVVIKDFFDKSSFSQIKTQIDNQESY